MVIINSPHLTVKNAPNMHCLHHLCYTLSLFTCFIVTIVYWGVTHKTHMRDIEKKYAGDDVQIAISHQHAYIVHIVPELSCVVLFLTSNTILMSKHVKGLIIFGICFSTMNFIATKYVRNGKPLYWFLDWKDHKTVITLVVLHAIFLSAFYGMAKIDEWWTGRSLNSKKSEKKKSI